MPDFREFIEELESEDQVIKIKKSVSIKHELAAVQWQIEKNLGKAVLFEKLEGYKINVIGNVFLMPLRMGITPVIPIAEELMNFYKTAKKPGIMYPLWMSSEFTQMYQDIEKIIIDGIENATKPKVVGDTLLTNIIKGNNINLLKILPIPKYFKEDGGHYITAGVTLAKEPDSDYINAGIYRIEVIDENKLAIMVNIKRDLRSFLTKAKKEGQKLEVAVAIGARPELLLSASMSLKYGVSELDVAGGMADHSINLTNGETISLDVPSDAEIVIEGSIDPQKSVTEGPFTEYDLLASQKTNSFLIDVSAIRFRDNPVYHSLVCTSLEMISLLTPLGITEMLKYKNFLKQITINIKDLWILPGVPGVGVVISLEKERDGEPKEIIQALFAFSPRLKRIVIVDDDIDLYDPSEIQWAIDTRVSMIEDIIVLRSTAELTDSARIGEFSVKIGIDATKKKGHPSNFNKSDISLFQKINFNEYM